jgi:hypothetical protein
MGSNHDTIFDEITGRLSHFGFYRPVKEDRLCPMMSNEEEMEGG